MVAFKDNNTKQIMIEWNIKGRRVLEIDKKKRKAILNLFIINFLFDLFQSLTNIDAGKDN